MADASVYRSVLAIEAAAYLASLPRRKQRRVLDLADRISRRPFPEPSSAALDADGRSVHNLLLQEYLFSYWVDHASGETRITQIVAV